MPFGVPAQHQIIVFSVIQMKGPWTRRWPVQGVSYTAGRNAQLLVLKENAAGAGITYFFKVPPGEDVWIDENVVHVPVLCLKQVRGDAIKCGA